MTAACVRSCPTCGKELPQRTSSWRYCSKRCQYQQGSEPASVLRRIERFFHDLDDARPWERDRVRRDFHHRP